MGNGIVLAVWTAAVVVSGSHSSETLRGVAEQAGLLVGSAARTNYISADASYGPVLAAQYNIIVPEDEGKWGPTSPAPGVYNFSAMNALQQFASSSLQSLRYHNLVWHNQMPDWLCSKYEFQPDRHCLETPYDAATFQQYFDQRINVTAAWYANVARVIASPAHGAPGDEEQRLDEERGQEDGQQGGASPLHLPAPGTVYCVDVVNEAINDTSLTFWNDVFYTTLGEGYLSRAFKLAKAAAPGVVTVYNDYWLEGTHPGKTAAALALLSKLKGQGVPIDAVGFQMHYGIARGDMPNATRQGGQGQRQGQGQGQGDSAGQGVLLTGKDKEGVAFVGGDRTPTAEEAACSLSRGDPAYKRVRYPGLPVLTGTMAQFAALGLQIQITELDIAITGVNASMPDLLQMQADLYGEIAGACLAQPACKLLGTWGFTDKYTWLGTHAAPLPFDAGYQPKPAFGALYQAIVNASAVKQTAATGGTEQSTAPSSSSSTVSTATAAAALPGMRKRRQ